MLKITTLIKYSQHGSLLEKIFVLSVWNRLFSINEVPAEEYVSSLQTGEEMKM